VGGLEALPCQHRAGPAIPPPTAPNRQAC